MEQLVALLPQVLDRCGDVVTVTVQAAPQYRIYRLSHRNQRIPTNVKTTMYPKQARIE